MILDFMVLLLSFLVQTPFFKGLCCNVVMLYIEGVPTASSRMLCTGIGAQPQSRCPVGPTVSANNMAVLSVQSMTGACYLTALVGDHLALG